MKVHYRRFNGKPHLIFSVAICGRTIPAEKTTRKLKEITCKACQKIAAKLPPFDKLKHIFLAIEWGDTELYWTNRKKWKWKHRFQLFGGSPKLRCGICRGWGHNRRTCPQGGGG